jgi:hypoxanthine phosphoribosyltransferase
MSYQSNLPAWVDKTSWNRLVERSKLFDEYKKDDLFLLGKIIDDIIVNPFLFRPQLLKWEDIELYVNILTKKIVAEYKPDVVIGVRNSGSVFAPLVSQYLSALQDEKVPTYFINASHYRGRTSGAVSTMWLNMLTEKVDLSDIPSGHLLHNQNLLIVDDDVATGITLREVGNCLLASQPKDIRYAVLNCENGAIGRLCRFFFNGLTPDFYVSEKAYSMYPWNRLDGLNYHAVN